MIKIGIPYTGCEHESEMPCTSEPEAMAIAAGIKLGGGDPFVFLQDSGYLNCLNNLGSLLAPYKIQIKMMIKEVKEPEHHTCSNWLYREIHDTIFSD